MRDTNSGDTPITSSPEQLEQAIAAFGSMMRVVRGRMYAAWLDVDLTMAQAKALMTICATGPIHGRVLAQTLGVGPPAVSKLVDHLVERGYVRRAEDPIDRRIAWLQPTEEGQALYDRLTAAGREALRAIVESLEPGEVDVVVEAWKLLRRAAERQASTSPKEINSN